MRVFRLSLAFLFLTGLSFAGSGKEIRWDAFEAGMKKAASGKKYVFVSVYTDWCGYCKQLDATTLKAAPVVTELGKNFVSIKLNAESDELVSWKGEKISGRGLAARWGVDGFPTLIFLNSKSDIIGSYPSFAEAPLMTKLLAYISSGARERKVSFDDYLKDAI